MSSSLSSAARFFTSDIWTTSGGPYLVWLLPSWAHCSKSPKVDFGSHSRRPAQDDSPRLVAHLAIRQSIDGATGRFRGSL
jgi:hypothetical protein